MPAGKDRDPAEIYANFSQITYGSVLANVFDVNVDRNTIETHPEATALKASVSLGGFQEPLTGILALRGGRKVTLDIYRGEHEEFRADVLGWTNPEAEVYASAVAGKFDPLGISVLDGDDDKEWKDQAFPIDPLGPRDLPFPYSTPQEVVYAYFAREVNNALYDHERAIKMTPFFPARSRFLEQHSDARRLET